MCRKVARRAFLKVTPWDTAVVQKWPNRFRHVFQQFVWEPSFDPISTNISRVGPNCHTVGNFRQALADLGKDIADAD